MHYVYILQCKNKQFYCGITDDVDRRFYEHKNGKGGHFTKKYGVDKLLYQKAFPTKKEAAAREQQIKGWSRQKKLKLIQGVWT